MGRTQRVRLTIVAALVACIGLGVAARLFELQVLEAEGYRIRARDQHEHRLRVAVMRGSIVDRNLHKLAVSVQRDSFYVHPERLRASGMDVDALAVRIAAALGRPVAELRRELNAAKPFIYLGRHLDPERAEAIAALGLDLSGNGPFGMLDEPQRIYPHRRLAAHVVGFAGVDGDGLSGIELAFDEHLRGDEKVFLIRRAALGEHDVTTELPRDREPPHDVVLTIDIALQRIVERELERAVRGGAAEAASAILVDPSDGAVLALANYPAPDLNRFGRYPARVRVNRALQEPYEPGSTFKMVPLAAALSRDRVHATEVFRCGNGRLRRPRGRVIHDVGHYDRLNVTEILAKSSNIGMVQIVERLTPDELYQTIRAFGFGEPAELELPSEGGLVRPPHDWSAFSQDSLSFGQELSVTVPQMAAMLATIARDGVRPELHLVRGLLDVDSHWSRVTAPRSRRVIDASTAAELRGMMEQVVTHGTGRRAAVLGYRVGGKSGTAQYARDGAYVDGRYVASFGGFAPVDAPRLVALVLVEGPDGGGEGAAPIFSAILGPALRHLRAPTDADLLPRPPAAAHRDAALRPPAELPAVPPSRMPELTGLSARAALARLGGVGRDVRIEGSGYVVRQRPRAGAPFDGSTEIRLVLEATAPNAAVRLARSAG